MEIMYVKYVNGKRQSIIKDGENIIMNNSKIIPFSSIKNIKKNEYVPCSNIKSLSNQKYTNNFDNDYKTNEKITNFFFEAIHKNYLLNRKK